MFLFIRAIGKGLLLICLLTFLFAAFCLEDMDLIGKAIIGAYEMLGWIACELISGWMEEEHDKR